MGPGTETQSELTEPPASSAEMFTVARLTPAFELVDWLIRSEALVARAALVPWLLTENRIERLRPATIVGERREMFNGMRSGPIPETGVS